MIYLGASFSSNLHTSHIHIQDASFHYNTAIPIYLSNQKLNIHGKIDFHRNTAESGGGIHIKDFSEVIFQNTTSVNFTFNTVDSSGGAIYLTDHSRVLFIDQSTLYQTDDTFVNEKVNKMFLFYQNRASEFGKDIYAYHHSNVMFGNSVIAMFTDDGQYFDSTTNALYADFYSNITFEGNSEVTFKNNKYSYRGALCIHDRSEVIFRGNTTVKFSDNIGAYESAAMCVNSSTAIFTERSTVTFNNNTAVGALYILSSSSVIFDESSTVMFSNNTAYYDGAVYVISSNIAFKGNSIVNFNHNEAVYGSCGGAMYIMNDCDVTFEEIVQ